ncbi:4Fe-4S cluster-binding domain-containing protein [Bacillus velezensis]|uniref:4Fe-4S cluster-binding domain-containing protein n=1 Tax=Bacillus velezensis TaxID=492670 RepID=UPI001E4EBCA1|nr:4Fe-4S cluster-binding domain-containing protein [Bacillus velezensis]MCD7911047.1 4Fe-4S cluster-binding domain-containing protein [Bacillus velezensis]
MTDLIRFIGVNKDTTTAGPGKRLEFFTKGCIRGVISPCFGCFNESTWTFEGLSRSLSIKEVIEICNRDAWNRQVTFCGGEPILQGKALAEVAKQLKEIDSDFHFVMYTAYKIDTLMKYGLHFTWVKKKHGDAMHHHLCDYASDAQPLEYDENYNPSKVKFTILSPRDVSEIMKHIDMIVDGDYQQNKRLTTDQYMHDGWFIGSSNQRVIYGPETIESGELRYISADDYNQQRAGQINCKCCGKIIEGINDTCGVRCLSRYQKRMTFMKQIIE